MKTIMVRIRVEPEFKQQLEQAVKEGKAKTISALIRVALREFLSEEGGPLR